MATEQTRKATFGFFDSQLDIYKSAKPYVCLVPLTHAPKDFPQTNIEGVLKETWVYDIRGKEDSFTLNVQGFQLVRHFPSYSDWQDGEKVVKEYYPHIVDLVKKNTGAEEVYIFDHTVRLGDHIDTPVRKRQYHGLPSTMTHIDHTVKLATLHITEDFGPRAEELLKRRFQIINIWHPIKEPVEQHFLTLCDYRTVNHDAFPSDLISDD